jgi:hypothetical protein
MNKMHISHYVEKMKISLNNFQVFLLLSTTNLIILFLAREFVYTRELYYSLFSDQMEIARIDSYLDLFYRISFWGFIILPIILLLKILITAFLLQIPLLLRYIEIPFNKLFRIVMLASIVPLAAKSFQYILTYFTPMEHLSQYHLVVEPLSLSKLIDPGDANVASMIVLNQCSVFELFWIIVVFCGLTRTEKLSKSDSAFLAFGIWSLILFLRWGSMIMLKEYSI